MVSIHSIICIVFRFRVLHYITENLIQLWFFKRFWICCFVSFLTLNSLFKSFHILVKEYLVFIGIKWWSQTLIFDNRLISFLFFLENFSIAKMVNLWWSGNGCAGNFVKLLGELFNVKIIAIFYLIWTNYWIKAINRYIKERLLKEFIMNLVRSYSGALLQEIDVFVLHFYLNWKTKTFHCSLRIKAYIQITYSWPS